MKKLTNTILATGDNKIPARIHAILAREADNAVVFRRGPSRKTAILELDLSLSFAWDRYRRYLRRRDEIAGSVPMS